MKKRRVRKKRLLMIVCSAAITAGAICFLAHRANVQLAVTKASPAATASAAPVVTPKPTVDPALFSDTDSLLLLANKKHRLPKGYEPSDLVAVTIGTTNSDVTMRKEASQALTRMAADAKEDGVELKISSAYRSESYQSALYSQYESQYGTQRADAISSRPGYSDHQTGLACDFVEGDGSFDGYNFEKAFEDTKSGKWLAKNAHLYGFILRYPEGKQDITGYTYEPWHFRYIGVEYATKIYEAGPSETFEEYFHQEGGDYADNEIANTKTVQNP